MMQSSLLAAACLWLHVIAATVWTGALAFFLFAFLPAARALPPAEGLRAFERGRRALQMLSWTAIQILFLTGAVNFYFRFASHPGGLYVWTLAAKLALFGAMIFHQSLQAFKYGPQLAAAAECGAGDAWPDPVEQTVARWSALLKINTAIGVVVLLLGLFLSGA
jgi:uncharacterized membrane protein